MKKFDKQAMWDALQSDMNKADEPKVAPTRDQIELDLARLLHYLAGPMRQITKDEADKICACMFSWSDQVLDKYYTRLRERFPEWEAQYER